MSTESENPSLVHGLSYPDSFLASLPVLLPRPVPHQAVRAINAKQFADIHLAHFTSDVTDSVVFPFLHGLEGENHAQNSFFANACGLKQERDPMPGAPTVNVPRYRGLVWVACDDDESPSTSGSSEGCQQTDDEDDDFDFDDQDDDDEDVDDEQGNMVVDDEHVQTYSATDEISSLAEVTPQMHPEIFRSTVADIKSKSSSPIPIAMSISLDNMHDRRLSVSSTNTSSSESHYGFESISESYSTSSSLASPCSASPIHDMPVSESTAADANSVDCIVSAPIPPPTPPLTPPTSANLPYIPSTFKASELLTTTPTGLPAFVPHRIPDGISLRNFGIQVPIYATLSDIVVYSRSGSTRAAFALAERFKHAIELQITERAHRAAKRGYKVRFVGDGGKVYDADFHELSKEDRALNNDKESTMEVDASEGTNVKAETDAEPQTKKEREPPVVELVLYNVFVLTESLTSIAEKSPWLLNGSNLSSKCAAPASTADGPVAPTKSDGSENTDAMTAANSRDVSGVSSYRPPVIDFAQREREEMRELTRATPIIEDNVFLGNSGDVPISKYGHRQRSENEDNPFENSDNPLGFDICIECHDYSTLPTAMQMRQVEMQLAALDAVWASKVASKAPPEPDVDDGLLQENLRPSPSAAHVIHLSVAASPQSYACSIQSYISLLNFLQSLARGPAASGAGPLDDIALKARSRKARILIYSCDGYTESSILALSLLMRERGLDLPSAYLELQVDKGRSFFVYQNDLGTLKRIESQLKIDRERDSRTLSQRVNSFSGTSTVGGRPRGWSNTWSSASHQHSYSFPYAHHGGSSWSAAGMRHTLHHVRSASNSVSYTSSPLAHYVVPSQSPSANMSLRRPRASTSPSTPMHIDHQTWFNDHRFDGSFPSRVLPFLYLGNLNHATNAYMLHALGITHVVSVGECALVPPENIATDESSSGYQFIAGKGPKGEGSLWIEEREGRIKVLDIKGVCDDGIDSLQPQLAPICAWIDRARADNGKVLIHCRVGVSRSATVTIAYVMKYLGIPLVDAYLIVRSRRLSVLIQPNMRLLYNLCSWEVKLAQERSGGDPEKLRLELSRSLNWPYLAREVHRLNEKYLS